MGRLACTCLASLALVGACFNPGSGDADTTSATDDTGLPSSTSASPDGSTGAGPAGSDATTDAGTTAAEGAATTGGGSTGGDDDGSTTGASACDPRPGTVTYHATTLTLSSTLPAKPIAVGDLDGDGHLDFAVTSADTGALDVFRGDGLGGFTGTQVVLDANAQPGALRIHAIADDAADLFVAMGTPGELWVYRGSGDGNFGQPVPYAMPTSAIEVADFDGDAVTDVVAIDTTGVVVRLGLALGEALGEGTPYTTPAGARVRVADITGDGVLDIVGSGVPFGEVGMLAGVGDGTFTALSSLVVGANIADLAVGQLDDDGRPDLLVSTSSGDLRVYYGQDDGTVSATGAVIAQGDIQAVVLVADVDGDGRDDVISQGGNDTNVRFSLGDRTFGAPFTTSCEGPPNQTVVGDFDHDCVIDIVTSDSSGTVCTLMSRGG